MHRQQKASGAGAGSWHLCDFREALLGSACDPCARTQGAHGASGLLHSAPPWSHHLCPRGSASFETADNSNLSKQLLPPLPTQCLAAVAFPSYKFQLPLVY